MTDIQDILSLQRQLLALSEAMATTTAQIDAFNAAGIDVSKSVGQLKALTQQFRELQSLQKENVTTGIEAATFRGRAKTSFEYAGKTYKPGQFIPVELSGASGRLNKEVSYIEQLVTKYEKLEQAKREAATAYQPQPVTQVGGENQPLDETEQWLRRQSHEAAKLSLDFVPQILNPASTPTAENLVDQEVTRADKLISEYEKLEQAKRDAATAYQPPASGFSDADNDAFINDIFSDELKDAQPDPLGGKGPSGKGTAGKGKDKPRYTDADIQQLKQKYGQLEDVLRQNGLGFENIIDSYQDIVTKVTTFTTKGEVAPGVVGKGKFSFDEQGQYIPPKQPKQPEPRFSPEEIAELTRQYSGLEQILGKHGLSLDDVTDAQKDYSTEITRFTTRHRNAAGVVEHGTIVLDKHGNQLYNTQKQYRSFGSAIIRNIAEVAKWTIAVQVIYAPLQKFQELVETAIKNEAKLADITIAVGKAQADVNKIFADAADVADVTGESLDGIIDGYELAYRAAGSIVDPVDRAKTANILLTDSMILSKLAGIDQATALDTLSGALKQLNLPLTAGKELLDKWVKVSHSANVSLETLAESFAITATSASGAGVDVDTLNGIIATVSENTTLSATEAGNAVRAFISGYETDTAQETLRSFGISVKTATGEAIGFYDVLIEIYNLWKSELISDQELNKIASAIGGGSRRQAQVVATITNLGRVQEVAAISATAHGDAEEALGVKLDTVQTKITELGNSFQELAQVIGTDGGVLDGIKLFLDVAAGGVDIITSLTKVMGTALPVMIAFGVAMNALSTTGIAGVKLPVSLENFGKQGGIGSVPISTLFAPGLTVGGVGKKIGGFMAKNPLLTAGIAGVGLQAAGNAIGGNNEAAIGNIGGGLAGALLGGLTGNPMAAAWGSQIGSMIGGSFVNNVINAEGTFSDFFADVFPSKEDEPPAEKTRGEQILEARQNLTDQAMGKDNWAQAVGAAVTQGIFNGYANLTNIFRPEDEQLGDMTRAQAGLVVSGRNSALVNEAARLKNLSFNENGEVEAGSAFDQKRNQLASAYSSTLDEIVKKTRLELEERRLLGEISAKQYNETINLLGGMDIQIAGFYEAFGAGLRETNPELQTTTDLFNFLGDTIAHATDEDIKYLSQLQATIIDIQETLALFGSGDVLTIGGIEFKKEDLEADLKDALEQGVDAVNTANLQYKIRNFTMPPIVGLDVTKSEFDKILEYAENVFMPELYQQLVDNAGLELTFDQWRNSFDPFFADLGKENGRIWVEGFSQLAITGSKEALEAANEILSSSSIGLKDFSDYSASELQSLIAQASQIAEGLKSEYGYQPNYEDFVALTSDGWKPVTAELTILQMLMRDLIDVNEKQVEGIYNLPTDASFYVPFTGYAKGQGGGGGGAGIGDLFDLLSKYLEGNFKEDDKPVQTKLPQSTADESYSTSWTSAEPPKTPILPALPEIPPSDARSVEPAGSTPFTAGNSGILGFLEQLPTMLLAQLMPNLYNLLQKDNPKLQDYPQSNFSQDYMSVLQQLLWNVTGGGFGIPTAPEPSSLLKGDVKDMQKQTPISTNFNLNIQSTTSLQLDGQIVANVVKQYLKEELIRQENTSTITRFTTI